MRGLKGLSKFVVLATTALTLMLMAAIGAAATSGTLGSASTVAGVKALDNGNHTGECHPPKKTHKHGTPGHKNHPCGEDGDDSD